MDGLCKIKDINVYSLVGRSVSIKTHKGVIWKTKKEDIKSNLSFKHIGFLNIPFLKQIGIGCSFFFSTLFWIFKNRGKEKNIIIDASYITALPFVLLASRFGKCKKIAIFCDIYEYMADVKDARSNDKISLLRKSARSLTRRNYKKLDGYVFLTEQMNSVINVLAKPYEVIEGLVDINMREIENNLDAKASNKVIMYAGALREQYGLKNLIEGFRNYKNDNARLWILDRKSVV